MAKLPIAAHNQAVQCDLRSILHQWSKLHLIITFHCRVTTIFVKVFLLQLASSNFRKWMWKMKCDKILFLVKKICSGLWSWCKKRRLMRNSLEILKSSIGIRPSRNAEKPLHCFPMLNDHIEHLHRVDGEYSHSRSLRKLSHHWSTIYSSSGYFKIICPYNSVREVKNVENCSLVCSSFPDLRTDRPLYWDLSRVPKKTDKPNVMEHVITGDES